MPTMTEAVYEGSVLSVIEDLGFEYFSVSEIERESYKNPLYTEELFESLLRINPDLSPDVIIKLSTDWKIMEFNSGAEKVFGIKRNEAINQSYIELFVPKTLRDNTEKQLKQLLKQTGKNKIKMKALAANAVETDIEWTADVLYNNLKMPSGILINAKK